MSNWQEDRAELEKELLEAKATAVHYESTLKPFRTVTDSEYREAKEKLWKTSNAIVEGDTLANAPEDPYAGLSKDELQNLYDEEVESYSGGAGSARQVAKIMAIKQRIDDFDSVDE